MNHKLNGKKYTEDIRHYMWDYSPEKWAKKLATCSNQKPEPVKPPWTRIAKHVKVKDVPQWFCWTCRRWHTSTVEQALCPLCGELLRRNGQSFVAWRILSI